MQNGKGGQETTETEIWKDIKGYEGLYQVSNLGRVKSLSRKIRDYRGDKARTIKETVLKPLSRNNYYIVHLTNNKRKQYSIHRLVAEMFIDNPENKPYVNHLDYNTKNNVVTNLEWCTQRENVQYSRENMKHRKNVTHSNTGEKYISFRKSTNKYRVIIDSKEYENFKTLEEAIRRREEILKNEKIS